MTPHFPRWSRSAAAVERHHRLPAECGEHALVGDVLHGLSAVVDHVLGRCVEPEPVQGGALVGFSVDRLAVSVRHGEEEGDAATGRRVVHDVAEVHVSGVDRDADLFLGLTDEGGDDGFAGLQVT